VMTAYLSFVERRCIPLYVMCNEISKTELLNRDYKYQIILTLIMSSIINLCSAQKIIDDIEIHIFEEFFNDENKISEIIELNESQDTSRYWRFNKNFQLVEEIDNRPSFWPYSAGWHSSARPSKKVFEYKYHSNGKIDTINEIHSSEGQTINTAHKFTFPNQNTITEFYKLDQNEYMNFDFNFTQIMNDSNISESIQIVKNYIGDSYVQTTQKSMYEYDERLKQVNHYFKVNSYPLNAEEKLMPETLGGKTTYNYDRFKRLNRIAEIEFIEEKGQKINRDMTLIYRGQSNKIEKIIVKYSENYTPREFEYNVEYENSGDLKTISVRGKTYNYIIKR